MNNMIKSKTTGLEYNIKEMIRIINPKQAATFAIHGGKLYDIFPSRHYETDEPVWVFMFKRDEVKDLYDKWCKYELR